MRKKIIYLYFFVSFLNLLAQEKVSYDYKLLNNKEIQEERKLVTFCYQYRKKLNGDFRNINLISIFEKISLRRIMEFSDLQQCLFGQVSKICTSKKLKNVKNLFNLRITFKKDNKECDNFEKKDQIIDLNNCDSICVENYEV